MAAVQARSRSLQRQKNRRRDFTASIVSVAACIVLIVGVGIYLPSTTSDGVFAIGDSSSGLFGSIVASGGYLSYIVIGILAFCLGIAVTILCVKLKGRYDEEDKNPWS